MTLRTQFAGLRRQLLSSVHLRPMSFSKQPPTVSFCFDDFPRTAYTAGGTILTSYDVRGTYYASFGLMGKTNELGAQFFLNDIDGLLANGHELACHTYNHVSCRKVSLNHFEREARLGQEAVSRLTGCDPIDFSYPFGHVTFRAKRRIGSQMLSCRGIDGGINGPVVDLNLLRANELYGDVENITRVASLLLEASVHCGWVIFYTHDVRRDPSPFGCTPALLDEAIALAKEKGFRIAPVAEVLASIQFAIIAAATLET